MLTEQGSGSIFLVALAICAKALGIWFIAWAVRRKWELDYPMDAVASFVRWAIVAASFIATASFGRLNLAALSFNSSDNRIGVSLLAEFCVPPE